jgi:enterochelin esterase-like enzyme
MQIGGVLRVFLIEILLSLAASGCSTPVSPSSTLTSPPPPATPVRTLPSTEVLQTESPSPVPLLTTATETTCSGSEGQIILAEIDHPSLPRALPFRVYLPPCYDEQPERTYPALYLLHGLQGTDAQWDELGIGEAANSMIESGTLPPFLIIMPWQRTGIEIETAVVEVLIPHIDQTYRTRSEPEWRAIGGVSRGAGRALQIALTHADLFSILGLHSPATLHAEGLILQWLLAIPLEQRPDVWMDIGDHDSLLPSAQSLLNLFSQNDLEATVHIYPGDHTSDYWRTHIAVYLHWYAAHWTNASSLEAWKLERIID